MARDRGTRELVEQLAAVPMFDGLGPKDLRRVCDAAKEMRWAPGEHLTIEQTRGSRFHLVLEGEVEVKADGRRRTTLGPGAAVGEIALIDGKPRSATVVALTPVRTLSIASWNFKSLLREHPAIAENVMRHLVRRIRDLERPSVPEL